MYKRQKCFFGADLFGFGHVFIHKKHDVTHTKHILCDTKSTHARRRKLQVILENILKGRTMRIHCEEE